MNRLSGLCAVIFTTIFLSWIGAQVVNEIQFDRECGGYLKRAADANTIEMATKELGTAISYLDRNNMTSGYTSILYQTPDEDVGFWYNNLSASLKELRIELAKEPVPSTLEKSNMLIKLRETLLDHGQEGESITAPSGISLFPANALYAFWGLSSFILACISWLKVFIGDDNDYHSRY